MTAHRTQSTPPGPSAADPPAGRRRGSTMRPTAQETGRIPRTAAVLLAASAVAAAAAGWATYRHLAPPVPGLVSTVLGGEPPDDPALVRDTLGPDLALVVGYGYALVVLCRLARMTTWSRTSRRVADLGLICAVATVVADVAENVLLHDGGSAGWSATAAGAAATVKWSAAVPAALTALAGLVLTCARALGNNPRALRRTAGLGTDGVIAPPPLEPPPPGNVPRAVPPEQLDSTRWRNAYRVPGEPEASAAADRRRVAVCLSGGGVRSASVALGALQALRPVVREADYVVSVSGGGYTAGALVQALTRGGSAGGDGVDRDPDHALAPGGVVEDHLRRHSSYLASTAGRLVLALALLGRGLVGSLFVLFSGAVVVGVLAGVFYDAVPVTQLGSVRVPAGGSSVVEYPAPHAAALWGLGVLAGAACLCWMAGAVLASWWDRDALVCRVPARVAGPLAALTAVVATVVLAVPAVTFASCWLYARTGQSSALTIGGPLATVLLSYLAALVAAVAKKPRRVTGLGRRARSTTTAGTTPASVVRLLLVTLVLVLLGAVWLLVFGAAVSTHADTTALWTALAVGAVWLVLGGLVDETALSLHPFYRTRLAAAFAVRAERGVAVPYPPAEPTTLSTHGRVDPEDWGSPPPRFLFAAAANLVDDDRTAPGLRAVSYVLGSDHIGGPDVGWVPTPLAVAACHRQLQRDLTVQAAVAISGAAFASSMGRASSWYGSLLAVSGARLGSWLPHPDYLLLRQELAAADDWTLPGLPRVRRFPYLLREVLGVHPYFQRLLHVTDGGHYENLGLVEALRRRCRTVYVVDASGDAPPTAGTFAAALRLARDELGVQIEPEPGVDLFDLVPGSGEPFAPEDPLAALNARLCARGVVTLRVTYPEESGLPEGQRSGVLVLAKAVLWRDLPYEVLAYAATDPVFPHDSTADQWFDEAKFSSYKRLGYELGRRCLSVPEDAGSPPGPPPSPQGNGSGPVPSLAGVPA